MSKLDETMEKFDAACQEEGRAEAALIEAEAKLTQLHTDSAELIEKIAEADQALDSAKVAMDEAARALTVQVDNSAFGRPHSRPAAYAEYAKARDAVSAAKIMRNTLNERADALIVDIKEREKAIDDARSATIRAANRKRAVAEQLRPLIASEVAGYTGKSMTKLSELPEVEGVEDATLEIEEIEAAAVAP